MLVGRQQQEEGNIKVQLLEDTKDNIPSLRLGDKEGSMR